MRYNPWDFETNGYFGEFDDERAALALVQTLVARYGPEYADSLSLGRVDDDGSIAEPIGGAALAAHAEQMSTAREPAKAVSD